MFVDFAIFWVLHTSADEFDGTNTMTRAGWLGGIRGEWRSALNTPKACACAAVFAFLAAGALGNTITYNLNMPANETIALEGYGGVLEVPQFDPSWGVLSSVTINVTVRFDGSMVIQNLDPEMSVIARGQMDWLFELNPPAGGSAPALQIPAHRVAQVTLDPYEEGNDYSQAYVTLSAQDAQQTVVTLRENDLAPFFGGGVLSLPIHATFSPTLVVINPPGAQVVIAEETAQGSFRADYAVTYNYVHIPEPVAVVLLFAGVLLRRR